jgi:hypothetical protein
VPQSLLPSASALVPQLDSEQSRPALPEAVSQHRALPSKLEARW